jgi:hypothetical protein
LLMKKDLYAQKFKDLIIEKHKKITPIC